MNWTETTIGQLVDVKHGFAFKGKHFSDSGRYVVLTPGNCENSGGFKSRGKKEKWYSSDVPDGYLLEEGELLVVMTDLVNTAPVLGGSFMIPEPDKYLHNQRLGLVEVLDEYATDKRFLYYLFNTHEYRGQVRGSASGATVRHTSPGRIKDCTVRIPQERGDQRRISSILSAYDDLIENNRRRIALLEEAARQLYKEWFVRFRFPGHEHIKIIDGVPEGWEICTYGEMFEFLGGFAFKSSTYVENGEYGVVTIKNVLDGQFLRDCSSRVPEKPSKMKSHCALEANDVLLSLTGNVGRACLVYGEKLLLNQRVAKVVGRNAVPRSFTYWTFSNRETQRELENLAYGVAQLNLSSVKLSAKPFVKPPKPVLNSFSEIAEPMLQQIVKLNESIAELSNARDLLLPKLMNGSLAV